MKEAEGSQLLYCRRDQTACLKNCEDRSKRHTKSNAIESKQASQLHFSRGIGVVYFLLAR